MAKQSIKASNGITVYSNRICVELGTYGTPTHHKKNFYFNLQNIGEVTEKAKEYRNQCLRALKHVKDGSTRTKYKHVYKYFNMHHELVGFSFIINRKTICCNKTFNIDYYGSEEMALKAAVSFRNKRMGEDAPKDF